MPSGENTELNYGEWGEIYVLLRLVGDGKIALTDEEEHEVSDYYLNVLETIRHETLDREVRYTSAEDRGEYRVIVIEVNDEETTRSRSDMFQEKAAETRDFLMERRPVPFSLPDPIMDFLRSVEVKHFKAQSIDKSDIFISAADPRSGLVRKDIGYSIKSKWSHLPTLFNYGAGTHLVYRLIGDIDDALIDEVSNTMDARGKADVLARWRLLGERGIKREFIDYGYCRNARCHAFTETLELINPYAIGMFEAIVRARFEGVLGSTTSVVDINQWLIETNPCGLKRPEIQYEYILKAVIYASYCGMTASTPWDGRSRVNGGLITVKADGSVVAFNALDGDVFKSYLFRHTMFEYPSTKPRKGNYGYIYWNEEYGCYCFDLNFQIRWRSF